jgi:hypothetical protein
MLNKHGDVGDFLVLIVAIFVLGLMIFLGNAVWDKIEPKLQTMPGINETASVNVNASLVKLDRGINILDPLFAVFFFGFYFAILISVFYIDTHPGFLIFGILMFIITMVVGMVMSDVFMSIAQTEALTNTTATAPITYFIMSNSPIFLIIMGFIFFIVLYASKRGQ